MDSTEPVNDSDLNTTLSFVVSDISNDASYPLKTMQSSCRILKQSGREGQQARMVISDLVTDREIEATVVNTEKWCSCIDGALTKENYLESIRKAGFRGIEVLEEKLYMEGDQVSGRKITSLVIRALKG